MCVCVCVFVTVTVTVREPGREFRAVTHYTLISQALALHWPSSYLYCGWIEII